MRKDTSDVVEYIISYLCEFSDEECQFSIASILSEYKEEEEELPCKLDTIRNKLVEYFGDAISVYKVKKDLVVCFAFVRNKILSEEWYNNKNSDVKAERKRIIDTAAELLLEDITSKYYDTVNYPAPDHFFDNIKDDIPPTLQSFLDILMRSNKRKNEMWDKRVMTLCHIIISSVRPRSFLSPILLGLSTMMYKKHASKNLIDSLGYLGLCASYYKTQLFESSIVCQPESYDSGAAYFQFVYDNADHNTCTIDGRNTFHAMGGIICATPASEISTNTKIERLARIPSANNVGAFGFVPLQNFQRGVHAGLKNIVIEDVTINNPLTQNHVEPTDLLWFYGNYIRRENLSGWNSFMEQCTQVKPFNISKIIPVPFVNAPPSSYDTIFTVLIEANEKCITQNQKHVFVTFDQPLYQKAREIVECCKGTPNEKKINKIVVRLGGFHMLMSYLGAVGYVMDGSGLKDAFCQLYAEVSAEKALTGHAYSRAIRGHILIQNALSHIIFSSMNLSESEVFVLKNLLEYVGKSEFHTLLEQNDIEEIRKKFVDKLNLIKENGPTAELWIQYFKMIELAKQFIQAERSGDWNMHLECVQKMLPYFHASGHNLYAKSAHLYLQDMYNLENIMDVIEFDKFSRLGYFTIRRVDKYRSGTWSDMIIEQMLMRPMKVNGGLTHGRGITDSTLCKWVLSTIVLIQVTDTVEKFCNITYATSDQHVDASNSRIKRDLKDFNKLTEFFQNHNPFPVTHNIISISSGIVGGDKINCHKAYEVGLQCLKKIVGGDFGSIKLKKKTRYYL